VRETFGLFRETSSLEKFESIHLRKFISQNFPHFLICESLSKKF